MFDSLHMKKFGGEHFLGASVVSRPTFKGWIGQGRFVHFKISFFILVVGIQEDA